MWFWKDKGSAFTGRYISLIQQIGIWGLILKELFGIELITVGKWLIVLVIGNMIIDISFGLFDIISGWYKFRAYFLGVSKKENPIGWANMETQRRICKALKIEDAYDKDWK